jgi:drug/metabolite transporter (DMT)-like permease
MLRMSTAYIAYAISICAYIVSQLLIKSRLEKLGVGDALAKNVVAGIALVLRDLGCWIGAILVLVGALCWYVAMTKLPIRFMTPMAAVIIPAAALGGYLFLGEQFAWEKTVAIGVITVGVVWLGSMGA